MKYILLLIVYFLSFQGFSQFNVRNYSKDYNLDGVLDTLYSHYDGGSSFGGTYVKITNGKTKEILEYDSFGPYAMITQVVSMQPNFILKKNKSFLNILKKNYLPIERKKPDSSLIWILNGLKNSKELTDNPYFNFIIYSKPEWINTKFKLAKPYYINNSKSELITLLGEHIYDDSYNEDYNTHLLSYNPSVLFSNSGTPKITDFETVISSDTLEILKSAHSIILKKEKRYKWLFITSGRLTDAPDRLRYKSIEKIVVVGNYLIFQHVLPPTRRYQIFVINITTGICGRLKFDTMNSREFNSAENGAFIIKEDHLILYDDAAYDEPLKTIELKKLFETLEKQATTK